MILFPNAKINLGLNVISRRADGFHNIETILYPVKINDALELVEAGELKFSTSGIPVPGPPTENICLRAYALLAKKFSLPLVHIHLHKQIPIGAGLGGGSADGAFCVRLLNEKFGLNITEGQMENYGRMLGSDCAFFIKNKPVLATGRGDHFTSVNLLLDQYFLVLVMPPVHVNTAEAYKGVQPRPAETGIMDIVKLPPEQWAEILKNDFEESVFSNFPQIRALKQALYSAGALYISMSGSGAAVYAIFAAEVKLPPAIERNNRVFYGV